jgi:hypothetical protein
MPSISQTKALDEYKRRKFVVIPLNGKRPFFKNWSTLDHTPLDRSVFDHKNIGILTGRSSKITVLDVDSQDGGMTLWNKIRKLYPTILTPTVATPGHGVHIYFKYNPKLPSTSKLHLNGQTIGWDILNDGRQVVAPPSDHYKWIQPFTDATLAKMPLWLEQYILLLKTK